MHDIVFVSLKYKTEGKVSRVPEKFFPSKKTRVQIYGKTTENKGPGHARKETRARAGT